MPKQAVMPKALARLEPGRAFCARDFEDVTSFANAKNLLARYASQGLLARLLPGVYCLTPEGVIAFGSSEHPSVRGEVATPNPNQNPTQNAAVTTDFIHPDAEDVARTIARLRGWTIAPAGKYALAKLGIVPKTSTDLTYVSTGSTLTYDYEGIRISFAHGRLRELVGLSGATRLVAQALRTARQTESIDAVTGTVARTFSSSQIQELVNDAPGLTGWMQRAINEIASLRRVDGDPSDSLNDPASARGAHSAGHARIPAVSTAATYALDPTLLDSVATSVRSALTQSIAGRNAPTTQANQ